MCVDLKKGAKVSYKGVCSFTVEQAKNGSNFIKGIIREKNDRVDFKVWNATNLEVDILKVVEIVGMVKEYDGKCYVEAAEVRNTDDKILDYVECSAMNPQAMFDNIVAVVDSRTSDWKDVLLESLRENQGVLLCAGYPGTAHTERGGFLAHLHEALYFVCGNIERLNRLGTPINEEIVIASTLLAKLWSLDYYQFNPVTGEVVAENKGMNALVGKTKSFVITDRISRDLPNRYEVLNAVGAASFLVDPATPEAVMVRDAFYSELRVHETAKAALGLNSGEVFKTSKYSIAKL